MTRSANVLSTDALDTLRAAVLKFGEKGVNALASADTEVRRTCDYVKERFRFWTLEVRARQEDVTRAKSALAFARAMRDNRSVGASEQEIMLKKAQARLREAEEKLEACKRWLQSLPDILREYEARVKQLSGFIESELPKAAIFLKGRSAALEAYLATIMPAADGSAPAATTAAPAAAPPPEVPPS
jgi:hypothetical protein